MSFCHAIAAVLILMSGLASASMPTWTALEIRNFAQSASDPSLIYAAANQGVVRSTDRGLSWEPLKLPRLPIDSAVVVHPDDARHVFVLVHQSPDGSDGYYESADAGATWAWRTVRSALSFPQSAAEASDPVRYLKIDAVAEGGAWWAAFRRSLWRSTDQGKTWSFNAQLRDGMNVMQHTSNGSFHISGNALFRSDDRGQHWSEIKQFDLVRPREGARNFLALPDGRLIVRFKQLWYESLDRGTTWQVAESGFHRLPDHTQSLDSDRRSPFQWSCRVQGFAASSPDLLATCIRDDGARPSSMCLQRSDDAGRTWMPLGDRCESAGLPQSWSPTTVLWDVADPNTIIAAWRAGGIYRSTDGGNGWRRVDERLQIRRFEEYIGFAAANETLLNRAVLRRDLSAVKSLLASGVDVNGEGNYMEDVLAADIVASENEARESGAPKSLYFELRRLGAQPRRASGVMRVAARLRMIDVVQDLVENGYNWGVVPKNDGYARNRSEFSSINWTDLGKPLRHWIEAYLRHGSFDAADQTVADLFQMDEPGLAMQVLEAASQRRPFDRQSTPISGDRPEIVKKLIELREPLWARRVYDATPGATEDAMLRDLRPYLHGRCEQAFLTLFPVDNVKAYCLVDDALSIARRLEILEWMSRSGKLTMEIWIGLVKDPAGRWAMKTSLYRRHAHDIEPELGSVGIFYECATAKNLIVRGLVSQAPAQQQGVLGGDYVVAIDGKSLSGLDMDSIARIVRGPAGSTALFDVQRGGQFLTIKVPRRRVDSIDWERIDRSTDPQKDAFVLGCAR